MKSEIFTKIIEQAILTDIIFFDLSKENLNKNKLTKAVMKSNIGKIPNNSLIE